MHILRFWWFIVSFWYRAPQKMTNMASLPSDLIYSNENVGFFFLLLSKSLSYLSLFLLVPPVAYTEWVPVILFLDYQSGGSFPFITSMHLIRVFWWCPIFLIAVSMVSSYGPSRPPQASYFLYGLSSPGEPQLCLVHASLFQSVIPSPSTDSNFKPQFKPRDLFSPKLSASYFLYHIYHRLLCYSWSKFVNSGKPFLPVAHCSTSKNLGFYPNLAIYPSSVAKFPHTKSKNILKQAL